MRARIKCPFASFQDKEEIMMFKGCVYKDCKYKNKEGINCYGILETEVVSVLVNLPQEDPIIKAIVDHKLTQAKTDLRTEVVADLIKVKLTGTIEALVNLIKKYENINN